MVVAVAHLHTVNDWDIGCAEVCTLQVPFFINQGTSRIIVCNIPRLNRTPDISLLRQQLSKLLPRHILEVKLST